MIIKARGTRREFELISMLRQAGKRFRKVTARSNGELTGTTIGEANVRDSHGVAILAIKRSDGWLVAPRGNTELRDGDEIFVVGKHSDLNAFEGVLA